VSDPFDFGSPVSAPAMNAGSYLADEPPAAKIVFSKPPAWMFWVGAAVSVVGAVLAWVLTSLTLAVVGWFLAGPIGMLLVIWFKNRDTVARTKGVYQAPKWLSAAYWVCVGVCLVAVVMAAVRVAIGMGRL